MAKFWTNPTKGVAPKSLRIPFEETQRTAKQPLHDTIVLLNRRLKEASNNEKRMDLIFDIQRNIARWSVSNKSSSNCTRRRYQISNRPQTLSMHSSLVFNTCPNLLGRRKLGVRSQRKGARRVLFPIFGPILCYKNF